MFHVILADDERETLNLLASLIHWEELNLFLLGESENGNDLCDKVDILSPHIVLIDMNMPGIHGAELIEHLTQIEHGPKVIVISGYDDFSYTKAAIKSRITGYLLKPVDEDELNDTLQKAIDELRSEQIAQQQKIQAAISIRKSQNILQEQRFWEHIENDNFTFSALSEFLPPAFSGPFTFVQVCAFRFVNLKDICSQIFKGSYSLLLYGIKNIVEEIFYDYGICYYNNQTKRFLLLILHEIDFSQLSDLLEQACHALFKNLSIQAYVGVSSHHSNLENISLQYSNALYTVDNMNLFTSSHVSCYSNTLFALSRPKGLYDDLLKNAFLKGPIFFARVVMGIYQEPQKYNVTTITSFLQLWDSIYKLCLDIPLVSEKIEVRSALEKCNRNMQQQFVTSNIIVEWSAFSALFTDGNDDDFQLGKKIKRYIDNHYQQNPSVIDLAAKYHLSRQHLFRIFKEETGKSPHSYILDKKIEKSKALLLNPEIKIIEIVSLLGFTDESHFSRVFKKATGMSPSQYRLQSSDINSI